MMIQVFPHLIPSFQLMITLLIRSFTSWKKFFLNFVVRLYFYIYIYNYVTDIHENCNFILVEDSDDDMKVIIQKTDASPGKSVV